MSEVAFTVLGEPMGKKRPKFARRGKFVHAYSPKENVDYEAKVREAYGNNPSFANAPLRVEITAYCAIPKSFSKKKAIQARDNQLKVLSKPDVDNVSKIILDALNEIAYDDDKQVVYLSISKFYSETPRVDVRINEAI